jgi:hypothetical protein
MATGPQTTNQIYSLIRQAIIDRDVVVATYHGYVREMCPHVVGTKNGRAQALLYQFAGGSSSGLGPDGSPDNWRCLFIDELSGVTTNKGPWHTAPNHSRPQTCVGQIDIEVAF